MGFLGALTPAERDEFIREALATRGSALAVQAAEVHKFWRRNPRLGARRSMGSPRARHGFITPQQGESVIDLAGDVPVADG